LEIQYGCLGIANAPYQIC